MTTIYKAPNGHTLHVGDVWKFTPVDNSPASKAGIFLVVAFPRAAEDSESIKVFHLGRMQIDNYGFLGPQDCYELVTRL